MHYPWRANGRLALVLFVILLAVTSRGWAKSERAAHVTRSEHALMRGVVRAASQAILFAQVEGRVTHVPLKEGQRFGKGMTLVQIDCDKYRAELASAIADHEAKAKTYQNNRELMTLNAVSTLEMEISEAEMKRARAAIRIAEIRVRSCRIAAPFSGRVVRVMVNEHENVFPNDKLLSVLDDTSLEIELVLPSASLTWLKQQSPFTFVVDETEREYTATVRDIGATVGPTSQTIKVIGAFTRLPGDVLAGMSGTAQFMEERQQP